MFIIKPFISTCFGHHYAHHQENKSVHCRIWCSALVVMVVVVWSWDASCVHCESYCAHSCSPDDGHNDARNMLRQKFDNKHRISCILLVSLSSPKSLSFRTMQKMPIKLTLHRSRWHSCLPLLIIHPV